MMKPLDKQVQETMRQLDTAYSNAYWEHALSHIDDRERRRRRIIGFWWVFAGAVLISAGTLIWWSVAEDKRDFVTSSQKQFAEIVPGEHAGKEKNLSKIKEEGSSEKEINEKVATSSNVVNKELADGSKIRTTQTPDNKLLRSKKHGGNIVIVEKQNQTTGKNIDGVKPVTDQNEEMAINETQEVLVPMEDISMLSVLSPGYLITSVIWDIEKPEFRRLAIIQPIKWRVGILSELNLLTNFPGRRNEKAILGGQASLGLKLKSETGFFTGISAGYAIRTGTFASMLDHPTPEYVFEEKEEGFRLVPTSLSYAQSQLYAGWERGRWSGKAGLQLMYLIGATGELYEYSTEASAEDPQMIVSRVAKLSEGSISTPAFRKWVFELQAGLEFAISEKWSITSQLAYTPAGLAYPLVESKYDPVAGRYESISGESILKEQFLHIQLGIQYKL
jgi:hypothetical protein